MVKDGEDSHALQTTNWKMKAKSFKMCKPGRGSFNFKVVNHSLSFSKSTLEKVYRGNRSVVCYWKP